jgi:2-polyprenyl-3-methyl-5-hydroxy-6-metoxy-1,4-benzoquinol methylase
MRQPRDYNSEIRDIGNDDLGKYAYSFDLDVMHPFMFMTFQPFFIPGSVLELGSSRGDFTRRLTTSFKDITCVEASTEAMAEAKTRIGEKADFVIGRFEDIQLPRRYDNIVLTHVMEHLEDPVRVLMRVDEEWLAEHGRLFIACPNAHAPSRQIAVKMGLISHCAAVTEGEARHGHHRTYTLDTLERDVREAGLRVVHRSGIFFKALANYQWDRLLLTDIITKDYLDGCYRLGQQYPDLCASIFLLCERGDKQ